MDNYLVNLDLYPQNEEHQEYIHDFSHFYRIVKGMDGARFQKKWYCYDTQYAPDTLGLWEEDEEDKERCFNTPENAYRYLLKKYRKYLREQLKNCEAEIGKFGE